ncbi:MAG TPA: DUF481 domain-containing protein [Thermoanaerobaculia bacterium]|nr:DUF481 domain-containing protein [Thermoanaerobaculia bacterium]
MKGSTVPPGWRVVLGILTAVLAAFPAGAAEIHLVNGDRITGEIVALVDGELRVRTAYAGEVAIDWGQVAAFGSEVPVTVVLADGSRLRGTVEAAGEGLRLVAAEREGAVGVTLAEVAAINPPVVPAVRYKGGVAASLLASSGNTESERLYFEGRFVARTETNRFTLAASLDEADEDGRQVASRITGSLGYDQFVSDRWFWSTSATVTEDELRDIDLRTALSLSAGYQVLDRERTTLALEAGASHVNTDYSTIPDEGYPAGRWAVSFDHDLLADHVGLFHRHEILLSLEDADDLLVLTRSGLRFALLGGLAATLQLNWDHDGSPAPGREENDRTWLVNLGYEW